MENAQLGRTIVGDEAATGFSPRSPNRGVVIVATLSVAEHGLTVAELISETIRICSRRVHKVGAQLIHCRYPLIHYTRR